VSATSTANRSLLGSVLSQGNEEQSQEIRSYSKRTSVKVTSIVL